MKSIQKLGLFLACVLLWSCSTDSGEEFSLQVQGFFPFQNATNWWVYTEGGGNTLRIATVDTISDDTEVFYKISFAETNQDTTIDWFKESSDGVLFSQSLTGSFDIFLPPKIESKTGSFKSQGQKISYEYADFLEVGGVELDSVFRLSYTTPVLHGFNEITFAKSIGIVQMLDNSGRFPVQYNLDSASISGTIRRY